MSYKELIEELIKRMKEVGYDPSSTFVKMLLKEYENLLLDNNTSNILLRSIISRLRGLPDHDRCIWLKTIIDEFDKELSNAKWKEGYEQGKFEGSLEPKKDLPEIPSIVGDWIEYCKFTNVMFTDAITINEVHFYNYANQSDLSRLKEFLSQEDNQEIFIRAWFNGYTVKKENKYIVKFKSINHDQCYLNCINNNDKTKEWILDDELEYPNIATKHTRKELKESGFEWVFDCPGVEIIEVVE